MPFCEPDTETSTPHSSGRKSVEAREEDSVHHQQGRMLGAIDGAAHRRNIRGHAGGSLVVHDAHCLDLVLPVLVQARRYLRRIDAMSPVAREKFGIEAQAFGQSFPQCRKVAGFVHQHLVARRQGVDQSRLPSASARRAINDHRAFRLEDFPDVGKHLLADGLELGSAMVDGRVVYRPEHAIGYVGRAGDLQKMSAPGLMCELQHLTSTKDCLQNPNVNRNTLSMNQRYESNLFMRVNKENEK